jgi:hypothetical protein
MRIQLFAGLAIIVAAGLFGAVAQQASIAIIEVPFSFTAAGKTFPQGTYEFNPKKVPNHVLILNIKTSESVIVPVASRLNPKQGTGPVVVFDKVNNDRFFSELYLPNIDGYAAEGCKGEHTHVQLAVK